MVAALDPNADPAPQGTRWHWLSGAVSGLIVCPVASLLWVFFALAERFEPADLSDAFEISAAGSGDLGTVVFVFGLIAVVGLVVGALPAALVGAALASWMGERPVTLRHWVVSASAGAATGAFGFSAIRQGIGAPGLSGLTSASLAGLFAGLVFVRVHLWLRRRY